MARQLVISKYSFWKGLINIEKQVQTLLIYKERKRGFVQFARALFLLQKKIFIDFEK